MKNLLTDNKGTLVGVEAQKDGEIMRVQARKGVILACGGFEHNENMKLQFFEAQPVYGVAAVGNTGDGIIMAQKMGASLWHMWHFHGSYGYKYPEFPIAFRHSIPYTGKPAKGEKMFSIVVDKFGKRYMNEIPPRATVISTRCSTAERGFRSRSRSFTSRWRRGLDCRPPE